MSNKNVQATFIGCIPTMIHTRPNEAPIAFSVFLLLIIIHVADYYILGYWQILIGGNLLYWPTGPVKLGVIVGGARIRKGRNFGR